MAGKLYASIFYLLVVIAWPINASEDIISLRKIKMLKAEEKMVQIKKSIVTSDYQQALEAAHFIENWANIMLNYFPKGSGASVSNSSAASSEIWENFVSFKQFVNDKQHNANKMLSAAKHKNKERLVEAFHATLGTCIACHNKFRN